MSTQDSGNSQPVFPVLCKNGCGFYGGIENKGYCSVCYKEFLKKEQAEKPNNIDDGAEEDTARVLEQLTLEEKTEINVENISSLEQNISTESSVKNISSEVVLDQPKLENKLSESSSVTDGALAAAPSEDKDKDKDGKKKKNRCLACKKKVGLTGFSCRCGGLFCSIHRYSDKHECSFDYKAMGEKEISEANPVVVAAKINKI